jgi:hypothetical protein
MGIEGDSRDASARTDLREPIERPDAGGPIVLVNWGLSRSAVEEISIFSLQPATRPAFHFDR